MATAADLDKADAQLKASDAAYTAARGKAASAERRLKELESYNAQDPGSVSPERLAQQRASVAAAQAEVTVTGTAYQASTDNWKQTYDAIPTEPPPPGATKFDPTRVKTESADVAVTNQAGPQTEEFSATPAATAADTPTYADHDIPTPVAEEDPLAAAAAEAAAANETIPPTEQAVIDAEEDPFEQARLQALQNDEVPPTESAFEVGEEDPFEARRLELEQEQNRQALTEQATEVEPDGTGYPIVPPLSAEQQAGTAVSDGSEQAVAAEVLNAQRQQTLQARQNRASQGDWRVRIHLAPGSNYLYNAPAGKVGGVDLPGPGILAPLTATDGVIFPYTPSIETSYQAKYQTSDLVHSNYRGYFYQGSYVDTITVRGTFTAQDTREAQYLLAAIHFFRSATKMFYGQDQQAGTPPPLVFLSGLGQFQFNKHPCVISNFTYSLPNDVDYIRADGFNNYGINLENRRTLSSGPSLGGALGFLANKLGANGLFPGGLKQVPTQGAVTASITNTTNTNSTYVPTKMEISVQMLPIQTRAQVSKQFSLQAFANGNLLKGGFW